MKFVCGLMAIAHHPIVARRRRRRPPLSLSSIVSMSEISTSAFYPLLPQISSAKFIRNLPIVTSAYLHIGILPLPRTHFYKC